MAIWVEFREATLHRDILTIAITTLNVLITMMLTAEVLAELLDICIREQLLIV